MIRIALTATAVFLFGLAVMLYVHEVQSIAHSIAAFDAASLVRQQPVR